MIYKAQMEYGHLILMPLVYRLRKLPNGQGEIASEYGPIVSGNYDDMLMRITHIDGSVEFEDASGG